MSEEAYLCAPPVVILPGSEYADDSRKFQGIPGIECARSGRLWATWYGGGIREDRDNYILLVTSGDGGSDLLSLGVFGKALGPGGPVCVRPLRLDTPGNIEPC